MKRSPFLIFIFLFSALCQAKPEIHRALFYKEARIPVEFTIHTETGEIERETGGYISFQRPRAYAFLVPAAGVALTAIIIHHLNPNKEVIPTFKGVLARLYSVIVPSAMIGGVAQLFYRFQLEKNLTFHTSPYEDAVHATIRGTNEDIGEHRQVTNHLASLLFAPVLRIKNRRSDTDYFLKKLFVDVSSNGNVFRDIRLELEPRFRDESPGTLTTSLFKVRPKKRRECLKDLFSFWKSGAPKP